MLRTDLLNIIDAAKGGRSDAEVSRKAGLPQDAIRAMRKGRVPSLERAAALADAVGLELLVCRKGEPIDPWRLRLSVMECLARAGVAMDEDKQHAFADALIRSYRDYGPAFDLTTFSTSEVPFRVFREILLRKKGMSPEEMTEALTRADVIVRTKRVLREEGMPEDAIAEVVAAIEEAPAGDGGEINDD